MLLQLLKRRLTRREFHTMQSRHSFFRWMVFALLVCIPSFAQNSRTIPSTDGQVICEQHIALPVALAPDQPATYIIAGELCAKEDELRSGTTVQLLIHGATYNHDYWDFSKIDGITYSYARPSPLEAFRHWLSICSGLEKVHTRLV